MTKVMDSHSADPGLIPAVTVTASIRNSIRLKLLLCIRKVLPVECALVTHPGNYQLAGTVSGVAHVDLWWVCLSVCLYVCPSKWSDLLPVKTSLKLG